MATLLNEKYITNKSTNAFKLNVAPKGDYETFLISRALPKDTVVTVGLVNNVPFNSSVKKAIGEIGNGEVVLMDDLTQQPFSNIPVKDPVSPKKDEEEGYFNLQRKVGFVLLGCAIVITAIAIYKYKKENQ